MKIIERAKMPNGTDIQIEDWSKDYNCYAECATVGAYPIAQVSGDRPFEPERNKTFRMEIDFNTKEEARECFEQLKAGDKQLIDFATEKDKKYL